MVQRFSYWRSVRNYGSKGMFRFVLPLLMISSIVFGQTQPAPEKIKTDVKSVQNAVNDVVGLSIPGWGVLQGAKAAYLVGYGIVVNAEIAFDPPVNPFSPQRSADEVRTIAKQRRKEVQDRLTNILKQKLPTLEAVASMESVAIILNILNTNPAYLPDMPAQIILSAKKQDAAHVDVREY